MLAGRDGRLAAEARLEKSRLVRDGPQCEAVEFSSRRRALPPSLCLGPLFIGAYLSTSANLASVQPLPPHWGPHWGPEPATTTTEVCSCQSTSSNGSFHNAIHTF